MEKVWLITGASKGFGLEITRAALAAGDKVIATFRGDASSLSPLSSGSSNLLVVKMDVTKEAEVKAAVEQGYQYFGRLDIIVNNAGYGVVGGIEEISDAEAKRQYETNVFGVLHVLRAVLPILRKQRSGHIVNISSLFVFDSFPAFSLYGSTKFAVEGISLGLSVELQPFGIKVTDVKPGLFSTSFTAKDSYAAAANEIADYRETLVGQLRKGTDAYHGQQPGDPRKLAEVVVKLGHTEEPPLHLLIGTDAVAAYRNYVARLGKEVEEWLEISNSTDHVR